MPHRSDPGLGAGRYHDMGDVLRKLGNRTLSFLGDSVASQHAHAMECSWWVCFGVGLLACVDMICCTMRRSPSTTPSQHSPPTRPLFPSPKKPQTPQNQNRLRAGKARTLFYEKEDYHRIFSANGSGFSRAGRYGTNALYTWRTELKGKDGEREEGEKEEGVQGTMQLYMTVRCDGCGAVLCVARGVDWIGRGGLWPTEQIPQVYLPHVHQKTHTKNSTAPG